MENKQDHKGGCLCGKIRFMTVGKPRRVSVCHCRYCQLRTGSALGVSVYFESDNVRIIKGENLLNSYKYSTESGNHLSLRFCRNCGTAIFLNAELFKELTGVTGGTFDPPTFWYDVEREVFCRSKAGFINVEVEDKNDTAPYHMPVKNEDLRLNGN